MAQPPALALEGELAAAQASRAWPFEEARRLIKRLDALAGGSERPVIFETGYGPSGLPHIGTFGEVARTTHGPPCLRDADRGPPQDPPDLLLRRHGRLAQGAGQRAEQGDAGRAHRQAADLGAGSLQRRVSELRRAQQRAAAPLPRPLRLRVRVPVGHRVLQGRPVRRHAAADARGLRRGDGHHPADLGPRAPRHLLAVPAGLPDQRQGAAGADGGARRQARHHRLRRSRQRQDGRDVRDGRPRQVPVEGRLGACAGPRWASTTRCAART